VAASILMVRRNQLFYRVEREGRVSLTKERGEGKLVLLLQVIFIWSSLAFRFPHRPS
jgi:hypothetical protein